MLVNLYQVVCSQRDSLLQIVDNHQNLSRNHVLAAFNAILDQIALTDHQLFPTILRVVKEES